MQPVSRPVQPGRSTTPPVGAAPVASELPARFRPRRIVRTFQPRFAALVEAGKKFQTIRPIPAREQDMPRVGDLFDARAWTGLPYRSKQRALLAAPVPITGVASCTIDSQGNVYVAGTPAPKGFAKADGFVSHTELVNWFRATHGLPFTGILIDWLPF